MFTEQPEMASPGSDALVIDVLLSSFACLKLIGTCEMTLLRYKDI